MRTKADLPRLALSAAPPSNIYWLVVLLMAIPGIFQLVPAIRFAVKDPTSDVLRQWRVAQYVQSRVNPYPVGLAALEAAAKAGELDDTSNLGFHSAIPLARGHKRPPHAGFIPKHGPHPDTRKDIGPPEATYPPPATMLLTFTIGYLKPSLLLPAWALLNLFLLVAVAYELSQLQGAGEATVWVTAFFVSLALLWPATIYFFDRGQFSLIVLWCILRAGRLDKQHAWLAGLLYTLALIKPSLALPFLLIPLLQRRWKVLLWTAGIQAALLLFASWFLRASPVALTSEWLALGQYFMQGMYTLQEVVNDLNLDGTIWNSVLPLVVAAASAILIYRADYFRALAVLSVIASIWTYHYRYDFIVLLCVMAFLLTPLARPRQWDLWQWSGLLACSVIGVALTQQATSGNGPIWHLVRWGCRLSLLWLIVAAALARRSQTASDAYTESTELAGKLTPDLTSRASAG